MELSSEGKQLNHYFNIPEAVDLKNALARLILDDKKESFEKIVSEGKKLSIRTRQTTDKKGEKVVFVIKASVDDDSSSNGVKRIEFESVVGITLNALDNILLDAGLTYQAKWSRERQEYVIKDIHICLDKNAGYGYLAEFEKVTTDENDLELAYKLYESIYNTVFSSDEDYLPDDMYIDLIHEFTYVLPKKELVTAEQVMNKYNEESANDEVFSAAYTSASRKDLEKQQKIRDGKAKRQTNMTYC
jgi:adenylate cyclase class IV